MVCPNWSNAVAVERVASTATGVWRSAAVDASGRINALDLAAVRQRLGTRLPSGEPAVATISTSSPSLASSPTQALFSSAKILF